MSVKLLTRHNLEFLSLRGGCTGSNESTLVKVPHCWKSHVAAHLCIMRNISVNLLRIWTGVSGENIVYPNYLCNVGRGQHEEHFCDFLKNLDQWFRCHFKIFLI